MTVSCLLQFHVVAVAKRQSTTSLIKISQDLPSYHYPQSIWHAPWQSCLRFGENSVIIWRRIYVVQSSACCMIRDFVSRITNYLLTILNAKGREIEPWLLISQSIQYFKHTEQLIVFSITQLLSGLIIIALNSSTLKRYNQIFYW